MLLDVWPRDLATLLSIFRRYDVPATSVGEVREPPYETIEWNGAPASKLNVGFRVAPPLLHRPTRSRSASRRASPLLPHGDLAPQFTDLVLAPDCVSREPVIRLYDHEVQGRTSVRPLHGGVTTPSHGDAAVLQPRPGHWAGLAVATASQPWACREAPRQGAEWVVEEAARNLYAVGARPDAFTNCLNFGNPEDPEVLGDFSAVTAGLASAARALGFAVPSGNVSFYNGGLGAGIPPTPVLLATGLVRDLRRAVTSDLKEAGSALFLLGKSSPDLGGSLWARRHDLAGVRIPPTAPADLRKLGERLVRGIEAGMVRAAHDVSDGGLAVTLAEMSFGGGLGFEVDLAATGLKSAGTALAAEGRSRFVVEVPAGAEDRFPPRPHPVVPAPVLDPRHWAIRTDGANERDFTLEASSVARPNRARP
jgi:phosphoribosylformylglycinamidine synthase